jgi:hypothetical protein
MPHPEVLSFPQRIWFARVPVAALRARLSYEPFRVLVAICAHADRDWRSRPSRVLLAQESRIATRNLGRNLRVLEHAGLIECCHDGSYIVRAGEARPQSSPLEEHTGVLNEHMGELDQHTGEPNQHTGETGAKSAEHQEQKTSDSSSSKGDAVAPGREAPLMHSGGAVALTRPAHPEAYAAAISAKKRHNWLRTMGRVAGSLLRGPHLEAAWEAISEAERAESWSATPEPSRRFLDRLDRLRRGRGVGV